MANTKSTGQLHIAMFPWFALGHFTPFLHLANKLAQRGHEVSFILPGKAQPKLTHLNHHPSLIHFYPLSVPRIEGLPPGTETTNEIPYHLLTHLSTAYDRTEHQVRTFLNRTKPHLVLTDFGFWVHSLARELGIKSVYFATASAFSLGCLFVPCRRIQKDMNVEELMQPPPGFPGSKLRLQLQHFEAAETKTLARESGSRFSLYERFVKSIKECDFIAARTCWEIEGPYCDYLAEQYAKPVLLTGPVLPQTPVEKLEEKWDEWLSNFEADSVVYCAFGSEIILQREQFHELLLGFEECGQPFLVALKAPYGCDRVEEAFPEAFEERNRGKGWVYGAWVPQPGILAHPSVGCFVSHCGFGSTWEALLSESQIVAVPMVGDEKMNARLMVDELEVGVKVNRREEDGFIYKESLSQAIKLVMEKDGDVANVVRSNHASWRQKLSSKDFQEGYIDNFIQNLNDILD